MRIGFFTDSHYSSRELTCKVRRNSLSLEKIREAYRYFEDQRCDLVICLGDLTDREDTHEEERARVLQAAEVISASRIPTVCVMGNHDGFCFSPEEFYGLLGGCRPVDFTVEGKTFLFLDACYFENGIHYGPGPSDWKNTYYPHCGRLKEALDRAEGEVYVFLHQNLDPEINDAHRVNNAPQIRQILEESGKVKTVYQGHYHKGNRCLHKGIRYVTFPAMCENENARFAEEI